MFHYRRYGFVLPQSDSFANVLSTIFDLVDAAALEPAPVRFLFDDAPGNTACVHVLERFPHLAPFALQPPPQYGQPPTARISNLDGRWQGGGIPQPAVEASRETLLALAAAIPDDFPLWIACFMLGPVRWNDPALSEVTPREASMRPAPLNKPPFSGMSPSMTYLAPGVILQRLSAGGLRLWVTAQFPDAPAKKDPPPPSIQKFIDRFGAPQTDSIVSVPEANEMSKFPPPSVDVAKIHADYKARMPEIVATLALPFDPPDPRQFGKIPHAPLGKIRQVIVDTFKPDGWKKAAEKIPAGSHKLCKQSPAGRRLELSFDTGSWSRHIVCILALITDRGAARITIPASTSLQYQYLTPNPDVFAGVLGNMRIVVAHLESTWLRDMEAAMGPASM